MRRTKDLISTCLNPSSNGIHVLGFGLRTCYTQAQPVLILLLMEYPLWGNPLICLREKRTVS